MGNAKRTNNMLKANQVIALHEWLKKNREAAEKKSWIDLERIASGDLGFTVTENNILPRLDQLGIVRVYGTRTSGRYNGNDNRKHRLLMASIARAVLSLSAALDFRTDEIVELEMAMKNEKSMEK